MSLRIGRWSRSAFTPHNLSESSVTADIVFSDYKIVRYSEISCKFFISLHKPPFVAGCYSLLRLWVSINRIKGCEREGELRNVFARVTFLHHYVETVEIAFKIWRAQIVQFRRKKATIRHRFFQPTFGTDVEKHLFPNEWCFNLNHIQNQKHSFDKMWPIYEWQQNFQKGCGHEMEDAICRTMTVLKKNKTRRKFTYQCPPWNNHWTHRSTLLPIFLFFFSTLHLSCLKTQGQRHWKIRVCLESSTLKVHLPVASVLQPPRHNFFSSRRYEKRHF